MELIIKHMVEVIDVPDSILPPMVAYRYWPPPSVCFTGSNDSIVRFVFYRTAFTDYEQQQLQQFKAELPALVKGPFEPMPDQEYLRLLLSYKFDFRKAVQGMLTMQQYRATIMPEGYLSLHSRVSPLLQSGAFYVHGRDHRFRPMLIVNLGRFDLKRLPIEEYCHLICFTLDYVLTNMMLPGQVENWIVITDLCNMGITQIPKSEFKIICKVLQDNFRCRMLTNYVLNSPRMVDWGWKVVKNFINAHTVNKIRIRRGIPTDEMRTHIAPGQLEAKYGGTAPDASVFWPPTVPEGPFTCPGEDLESFISDSPPEYAY
jgi:hypothetical protein